MVQKSRGLLTLVFFTFLIVMGCSRNRIANSAMYFTLPVYQEYQIQDSQILRSPRKTMKISPRDIESWDDVGFDSNLSIEFEPGDYRKLGTLRLDQLENIGLIKNHEEKGTVLLEAFHISRCRNIEFTGIKINGIGNEYRGHIGGHSNMIADCVDIKLEECVIEGVLKGNALRIRNSENTIVNRCAIKNKIEYQPSSDNIAIDIHAFRNRSTLGTIISNCEIYNYTDGIQINYTWNPSSEDRRHEKSGDVSETLIINNDIYITQDLYHYDGVDTLACAENGIDIKGGSTNPIPENLNIIRNNRLHGFRPSMHRCGASGSTGDGIVVHFSASNWLIQSNVIYDCYRAIHIKNSNPNLSPTGVRNIELRDNWIWSKSTRSSELNPIAVGSPSIVMNNVVVCKKNMLDEELYQVDLSHNFRGMLTNKGEMDIYNWTQNRRIGVLKDVDILKLRFKEKGNWKEISLAAIK